MAEARWAAVLGSPVAHSLSPALHRAAYASLGLDAWTYTARECTSDALGAMLDQARHDPAFAGYSLTMPLKVDVLPLLDDLEPLARSVGAVNTVVPADGRLVGANTDVPGMVAALHRAGVRAPRHAVVLGAGGSAQAALAALVELGGPSVVVLARRPEAAGRLYLVAAAVGLDLEVRPWGPLPATDLVVATTPAGATDALAAQVVEGAWPDGAALFDILYAPWPTALAAAVLTRGGRVVGGLELLVGQAVGQVERMTGQHVDAGVLRRALLPHRG